MFDWIKKIFGAPESHVLEEKRYFFLAQEDEEVLGFLSDRYSEALPKLEGFLSSVESPPPAHTSDLERILSSSSRNANFALALVHMYSLQQSLLSGVSKILSNKQRYMAENGVLDLATNFKIPNASGRCPRSVSMLAALMPSLKLSPPIPIPSDESIPLWDNPTSLSIDALPSYAGFHALCSLLLDVKDLPDPVVENTPLLRNDDGLEVRINDSWVKVSECGDELRRRQRFFLRRMIELKSSFLENTFPSFLLSLNYESLLFCSLNFFSLESALNDLRAFLSWYSEGDKALSEGFQSDIGSIEAEAVDLYSSFNGLSAEFEAKLPLLGSNSRSDAFLFLEFLEACSQAQARLVNGLVKLDSRLSALDSSLGSVAKKVWRFDFKRIGGLYLLQFMPYSSFLSAAAGRTIHPHLRSSYLELASLLGNNMSMEVSSERSFSLLKLYLECNVSISSVHSAEPSRLPLAVPVPSHAGLSRDLESRFLAVWDGV